MTSFNGYIKRKMEDNLKKIVIKIVIEDIFGTSIIIDNEY